MANQPGATKEYTINSRTWTNVPLEANKAYSVTARENGQVIYVSDSPTGNNAVRLTKNFNIQTTGRTSLYLKGQSDLDIKIDEINATLVLKADKANTYTKAEIDAMLISGGVGTVIFKGEKPKLSDLYMLADARLGDMWWVKSEGAFYLCIDEAHKTEADGWSNVGSSVVNLADYYTKLETNALLDQKAGTAEITRLEELIRQMQAANDFDYVSETEPSLATAKVGQIWLKKSVPSIKTCKLDGKNQKFWFDMTDNVEINLATKFVSATKDQEVSGVKNFRTLPISDMVPMQDKEFVTKKYVDDKVAAGGGGQGGGNFNPDLYYTKTEVDTSQRTQNDEINTLKEGLKKAVTLDTAQEITAVKTFSQNIKLTAPINADNDVVTKKYVDDKVAAGGNFDPDQYYTKTEIDTQKANYVTLANAQNIAGVKTFDVSPKVPEPTADNDATNKKFVTDKLQELKEEISFPSHIDIEWGEGSQSGRYINMMVQMFDAQDRQIAAINGDSTAGNPGDAEYTFYQIVKAGTGDKTLGAGTGKTAKLQKNEFRIKVTSNNNYSAGSWNGTYSPQNFSIDSDTLSKDSCLAPVKMRIEFVEGNGDIVIRKLRFVSFKNVGNVNGGPNKYIKVNGVAIPGFVPGTGGTIDFTDARFGIKGGQGGGGAVDTSNLVTLDTDQEITAVKTFTTAPKSKLMPAVGEEVTNKKYVDLEINSFKNIFTAENKFFVINGWATWDTTANETKVFNIRDMKVYCNGVDKALKLKSYNVIQDNSPQSGGYDPLQYYCVEYVLLADDNSLDPARATQDTNLNETYLAKENELLLKIEPVTCWNKTWKGYYAFGFNQTRGWLNGYPFLQGENTEEGKKEWSRFKITPIFNQQYTEIHKVVFKTNTGSSNPMMAICHVDIYENMDVTDNLKPLKSYKFTQAGEQTCEIHFLNMKGTGPSDTGQTQPGPGQTPTFDVLPIINKGKLPDNMGPELNQLITRKFHLYEQLQNRVVITSPNCYCSFGKGSYWTIGMLELYGYFYNSQTEVRLYPLEYQILKDENDTKVTEGYKKDKNYAGHEVLVSFTTTDPGKPPVAADIKSKTWNQLFSSYTVTLKITATSNINAGTTANSIVKAFKATGEPANYATCRFQTSYPNQNNYYDYKRITIEVYIPQDKKQGDLYDEPLANYIPYSCYHPKISRIQGVFGHCPDGIQTTYVGYATPSVLLVGYESMMGPNYFDYQTNNAGAYWYESAATKVFPSYNWDANSSQILGNAQVFTHDIDISGCWRRFDKNWVMANAYKQIIGINNTYATECDEMNIVFTQAEYDALSDLQKMNGKFYFIKG